LFVQVSIQQLSASIPVSHSGTNYINKLEIHNLFHHKKDSFKLTAYMNTWGEWNTSLQVAQKMYFVCILFT